MLCFDLIMNLIFIEIFCYIIEYDPVNAPPFAEHVLEEKRRRLRDSLDRIIRFNVSILLT